MQNSQWKALAFRGTMAVFVLEPARRGGRHKGALKGDASIPHLGFWRLCIVPRRVIVSAPTLRDGLIYEMARELFNINL